ncbi:MAG: hypothetical protein JWR19_3104 [Pedosphaera sp.]|nr:hypothetical protein [Pedosphaera sp.]
MKRLLHFSRMLVLTGLLMGNLPGGWAVYAQTPAPLSAEEVMQRAVERAESSDSHIARPNYLYHKHTITEELDTKGRLKEHKEKLYQVMVESGLSYIRLIQINGQSLSVGELKKEDAREAAERAKLADAKPDSKGDNRENFLTRELVAKYKLTLLEQKMIGGRATYVVAFEPKSGELPVKRLTDRFANRMAGTVWIDVEDFELAKAEIHLQGEVALWGGIVGTLKRCNYTLMRTRLPDGTWFNSFSHGVFEGRKLLEPMLVKTMSESSNFQKVALAGH